MVVTSSGQYERGRLTVAGKRYAVDAPVAAAVAAAQAGLTYAVAAHQGRSISAGDFALLVAGGVALIWRRRFPVWVLVATYVTTLWYAAGSSPNGPIWDAVIVAFGTAIYFHRRKAAITTLIAGYVGFLWGPTIAGTQKAPSATFALALGLGLLVMLAAAEGIRLKHERSEAQVRGREEEALRRAGEERIRIARELHDVVAHNISVINVQSNTALHLMGRQPEIAREALSTIHEVSRQALVELRSILGVLRSVDDEAPRGPAPGLGRLEDLVGMAKSAGVNVRVEEHHLQTGLPAPVDLAAYRIVQEALTNVARHAAGATAVVRVACQDDHLLVEVDDDGGSPAPGLNTSGAGSGILGMAERAQALGGTLEAGPRPGRGFHVCARLPIDVRAGTV